MIDRPFFRATLQILRRANAANQVGTALVGWAALSDEARRQKWIQYVNGLVGIGLIALPFVFELSARPHVTWTHAVSGLIALVLSTLNHSLPRVQGKRLAGAGRAS